MRNFIGVLATTTLLLILPTVGGVAAIAKSVTWAPLDDTYLRGVYANKTWKWKHGAAYFAEDGTFKAWSRDKGVLYHAFGTWTAVPDGKLCFSASWRADASSDAPIVETCFSHSARGRDIAQMKEPDGKWYLFKHAKTRKGDEFLKLRPGDITGLKSDGTY